MLIANRGEIALRIIRSAKKLNIKKRCWHVANQTSILFRQRAPMKLLS
ncbi:biotin carboxylase N-terminal domain-containing protein [Escherichia coli]